MKLFPFHAEDGMLPATFLSANDSCMQPSQWSLYHRKSYSLLFKFCIPIIVVLPELHLMFITRAGMEYQCAKIQIVVCVCFVGTVTHATSHHNHMILRKCSHFQVVVIHEGILYILGNFCLQVNAAHIYHWELCGREDLNTYSFYHPFCDKLQ